MKLKKNKQFFVKIIIVHKKKKVLKTDIQQKTYLLGHHVILILNYVFISFYINFYVFYIYYTCLCLSVLHLPIYLTIFFLTSCYFYFFLFGENFFKKLSFFSSPCLSQFFIFTIYLFQNLCGISFFIHKNN